MLIFNNTRKADKGLYNNSAEDFIPIACHYDSNTLLTKNGELLQIIQINGINSERITSELFNLREIVRGAIKKHVKDDKFAFWLHTIRRKTNLDDLTPYKKTLPANIHNIWKDKNYWDDKFVNTLYISIIYDSTSINVNNINTLIKSLFTKATLNTHNQYLDNAFQKLSSTVNDILSELTEYGATKLGIRFVGDDSFSDMIFLYHKIIHLSSEDCLVPITDLSVSLASNQYALGSDKIEVISRDRTKKFTAILSIKEYQEISADALDRFIQLPVEFIATEIFYVVDKKEALSLFEEQNYILQVSGDSQLKEIKKRTSKGSSDDDAVDTRFCRQQISIAIIGNDIKKLEISVKNVSKELSRIGIVHVREDINLEQTFWAQLPGNFSFLRRMSVTILDNTAALASLHNFPTGNQYNPWGKAVTLLRTERGTPYFMNFHVEDRGGNSCIFGTNKTGKTVLTNFLISESSKFNPTILYLADNNDSKIFVSAIEGIWLEETKSIINPFLLDDTTDSRQFINEFFKIICNHHTIPLTESELIFLEILISKIFTLEFGDRNLSAVLKIVDFSLDGGELIKVKLNGFNEGELYHGIFDNKNNLPLSKASVTGINLYYFTEKYFTATFYPNEQKLVEKFKSNLKIHNNIRASIIYALNHYLIISSDSPKILVLDNMNNLLPPNSFLEIIANIMANLTKNNGISVSNFNISSLATTNYSILSEWIDLYDTKIILPSDVLIENLDKIFKLNKREVDKLISLTISSRMFLIIQNSQSIAVELSIGAFSGILRILSSHKEELGIYQKILNEYPGHPDAWINHVYKAFETIE